MLQNIISTALLLFAASATALSAQQDVETLIDKPDADVQTQIAKVLNALQKSGVKSGSDLDVCREVQTLKKLSPDQDRLVKQLAIFVATMKSAKDIESADEQLSIMQSILDVLDVPPRISIRVLAPYLDADNRQLRDSVHFWFTFHDSGGSMPETAPRITPMNYDDYEQYVESKLTHKADVPEPFTRYIFQRSPGRSLLVFAYASAQGDMTTRGLKLSAVLQAKQAERHQIELAEHIVSNAIWFSKNGFADQSIKARPEAIEQLEKLAKHDQWWARLYVAYIMQQNPPLLRGTVLRELAGDKNELVSKAAKSAER